MTLGNADLREFWLGSQSTFGDFAHSSSLGVQASHPAAQVLPEETQMFRFFRGRSQELHPVLVTCPIADDGPER